LGYNILRNQSLFYMLLAGTRRGLSSPAIAIVALLILSAASTVAKQEFGYQGTDFLVAFMPNDHRQSQNPDLLLFLTASQPTECTVTATDRNGAVAVQTVAVATTPQNTVAVVRLPYTRYELVGVDDRGRRNDAEVASPCHIRIESTDTIAVYACSRESRSTDAWLVFPTSSLGKEHYVMSYESDVTSNFFETNRYPSQFVVVANENDTDVEIRLSTTQTQVAQGNIRRVRLQRGQSYLVQAFVSARTSGEDLTGTLIRSTKPVAVVSGHFRAAVPRNESTDSRDLLAEQLPSVDKWGTSFAVAPMVAPSDAQFSSDRDRPLYRIVAAVDSTIVTVNGLPLPRLNSGTHVTQLLTSPVSVQSNHPILVAVIDRSSSRSSVSRLRSGDPSLIVVPPIDQYLTSYRVMSIEPEESGPPAFTEHWLMITFAQGALPSLRVDGQPVAPTGAFPGTDMVYAHVSVASGSHEITCNEPIGAMAVGYGPVESYGYTAGLQFKRLREPSIRLRITKDTAAIGDSVALAVVVDSIANPAEMAALAIDSVQLVVGWDASVMVPAAARAWTYSLVRRPDVEARMADAVRAPLALGDTIGILRGVAVLGRDTAATIASVSVSWTSSGLAVSVPTTVIEGTVVVTGHCNDDSTRLFDPQGRAVPPAITVSNGVVHVHRDGHYAMWWVDYLGRQYPLVSGTIRAGQEVALPSGQVVVGVVVHDGQRRYHLR